MKLTRPAVLRVGSAALSLLVVPHAARSDDLSNFVRRAVVRSAQIADQADSVWQQVAGEVVPAWQKPSALPAMTVPPPLLERAFADALLALPLEAAAQCSGGSVSSLTALVPGARQDAALLYQEQDDRAVRPLQNEPFYGALSKPGPAPAGVALRGFAPSLVGAAAAGDFTNSTLFGFEAYARWRVLQGVLSDDRPAEERRQLQRCFSQRLGDEMLSGPLRGAKLPTPPPGNGSTARSEQTLLQAVEGCGALLDLMQANPHPNTLGLPLPLPPTLALTRSVAGERPLRRVHAAEDDGLRHRPLRRGGLAGGRLDELAVPNPYP